MGQEPIEPKKKTVVSRLAESRLFRQHGQAVAVMAVFALVGVLTLSISHGLYIGRPILAHPPVGPIMGLEDKCAGVTAYGSNASVQLRTCTGTAIQTWERSFAVNSTTGGSTYAIDNGNYCLDVKGGAKTAGALVVLYGCDGNASQQWVSNSDGTLVNTNSGLCLTDQNSSAADGTLLELYTCSASMTQIWTPPSPLVLSSSKYEPANGQIYLGVDTDASRLATFDTAAGITTHPAIVGAYSSSDENLQSFITSLSTSIPGVTPMISWNIPLTNSQITDGSEDTYLETQAAEVKAYGQPIFLRPDWEMNDSWFPNWNLPNVTPAEYIAAWQHIVTIFRNAGATNAAFVWCPGSGNTNNPSDARLMAWYPGNDYVDWMATDAYPQYDPVTTFLDGTDRLNYMAEIAHVYNKPLMLAEWSPNLPNPDTAAPIDLVFDWAEEYPTTVKALVYFDYTASTGDHTLVDHPVGAAEFRKLTVGNPNFLDNVTQ